VPDTNMYNRDRSDIWRSRERGQERSPSGGLASSAVDGRTGPRSRIQVDGIGVHLCVAVVLFP
jgi:hypothetical protein